MNRNARNDGKLLINVKAVDWPGNKARLLISLSVLNIFTWLLTTTFTVQWQTLREKTASLTDGLLVLIRRWCSSSSIELTRSLEITRLICFAQESGDLCSSVWPVCSAFVQRTNNANHCKYHMCSYSTQITNWLQTRLLGTLILALISLFSSMGISAVSGAMAIMTQFKAHRCKSNYRTSNLTLKCEIHEVAPTWLGFEWTLLVLGAVGFLVNLAVFVVVSTLLCRPCCPQQRIDSVNQYLRWKHIVVISDAFH